MQTHQVVAECLGEYEKRGLKPKEVRLTLPAFFEIWAEYTGRPVERLWNEPRRKLPTLYGVPVRLIGKPGYKVEVS